MKKANLIRELALKLRQMKKGQEFTVTTDTERRVALLAASAVGIEIHTRKSDTGGFRVIVI